MSREDTIYTLVPSANSGRYAGDDSEHGPDLSSGQAIAIEVLDNLWIEGRVEHRSGYSTDTSGLYHIADRGRNKSQRDHNDMTQAEVEATVHSAMAQGASLQDALMALSNQTTDLFCGYYFISKDGQIIGLCTGMRIKSL